MKLWLCYGNSDDCQPFDLIIAETEDDAKQKFEDKMSGIWFASVDAEEVRELEGYEVIVRPKRNYAKNENPYTKWKI
jgi:hypothetical protein